MRYGENYQKAAFYIENDIKEASAATAVQLQGKSLLIIILRILMLLWNV